MIRALLLTCFLALGIPNAGHAQVKDSTALRQFEAQVRPVLAQHCYPCHSAQSKAAQGGLKLDTKEGWQRGGASGPAVVPHDPSKSILIQAIRWEGTHKPMPPAGKLTSKEIAALEEWVKNGAPDPRAGTSAPKSKQMTTEQAKRHWAFQPLRSPTVPDPFQKPYADWNNSPIDRFLLTAMRSKGLTPASPAERRTLLRRVSFDLTGLPPTPEQVMAFVGDRSPNAWEKVIDRLLANPAYGERWARHWLDLSRFAESHGYEQDYDRPYAFHFRDFAIKALNQDLPYNTFVKWQLAGDEYEPDNPLALMATGFLAAGTHATQITKNQVEKERYDELDDMVNTTGVVFLGLTLGCARCHDHKYDPVSTREYYRLASTFTTTVRSDYEVDFDPEGYKRKLGDWKLRHQSVEGELARYDAEQLPRRAQRWFDEFRSMPRQRRWLIATHPAAKATGGGVFTQLADHSLLISGANPPNDSYELTLHPTVSRIAALRLEALTDPSLPKGGPGRASNGNFALTNLLAEVRTQSGEVRKLTFARAEADFEQKGLPVSAVIDSNSTSGWAVDGKIGSSHSAIFALKEPVQLAGSETLTVTLKFDNNNQHSIGRVRVSLAESQLPLTAEALPDRIDSLVEELRGGLVEVDRSARKIVLDWYSHLDEDRKPLAEKLKKSLAQQPRPDLQKVMISSEGVTAIRTHTQGGDFLEATHFLKRGDPNQKGEVATQGFIATLMRGTSQEQQWKCSPPTGWRTSYQRRSLAEWLTDVDQGAGPLLARVMVNRVWQKHFGHGLVRTMSDFGAQGEKPSHPELLEWLSREFVKSGWSLKKLHKLLLMSQAYQQSSRTSPSIRSRDPENRFVTHIPRRRLEAEAIRDAILAVSGLLDPTMYGPGTLDEGMRRRSIYFFIKRSRLIPTLMTFDAPNSLGSLPIRATTTVAPQALLLLNSPIVRQASSAFAKRLMDLKLDNTEARINQAFTFALGRQPSKNEQEASAAFLHAQEKSYHNQSTVTNAPELALADFCQLMFGLNEFAYAD